MPLNIKWYNIDMIKKSKDANKIKVKSIFKLILGALFCYFPAYFMVQIVLPVEIALVGNPIVCCMPTDNEIAEIVSRRPGADAIVITGFVLSIILVAVIAFLIWKNKFTKTKIGKVILSVILLLSLGTILYFLYNFIFNSNDFYVEAYWDYAVYTPVPYLIQYMIHNIYWFFNK